MPLPRDLAPWKRRPRAVSARRNGSASARDVSRCSSGARCTRSLGHPTRGAALGARLAASSRASLSALARRRYARSERARAILAHVRAVCTDCTVRVRTPAPHRALRPRRLVPAQCVSLVAGRRLTGLRRWRGPDSCWCSRRSWSRWVRSSLYNAAIKLQRKLDENLFKVFETTIQSLLASEKLKLQQHVIVNNLIMKSTKV